VVTVAPDQRHQSVKQEHGLDGALDWIFLHDAVSAASRTTPFRFATAVRNVNRAVGTLTGSAITRSLGERDLPDDLIEIDLDGSSGQSLAPSCPRMTLRSPVTRTTTPARSVGGRIIIRPSLEATFASEKTSSPQRHRYGATSGEIFVSGVVGERCGVRNSGRRSSSKAPAITRVST